MDQFSRRETLTSLGLSVESGKTKSKYCIIKPFILQSERSHGEIPATHKKRISSILAQSSYLH